MRSPEETCMLIRIVTLSTALAFAGACSKSKDQPAPAPASDPVPSAAPKDPAHATHQDGDRHDDDHHPGDQHPPEQHPPEPHESAGAQPLPTSFKEAVTAIDTANQQLAAIVKDGDLSKAHEAAGRLAKIGPALSELATKAGLGVEDVKALTIAGKKLGLLFEAMDAAGDAGKRDVAQKVLARYAEPLAVIKAKAANAK